MRVLHLIETLGRGGAEQALVNLLPTLNSRGVANEVAFLWGASTLASKLKSEGIPVHALSFGRRWSPIKGRVRLRSLLERRAAELVVSHLYFGHLYGALAGGPPNIQVFHNQAYDQAMPRSMRAQARLMLHRVAARKARAHVAVSQAAALSAARHLKVDKPVVIPNAFPCQQLRPDAQLDVAKTRAESSVPPRAFLVICASRLVPEKGLETLIFAFSEFHRTNSDAHLLIVGEGPLRSQLTQVRDRLQLQDAVTLHPAIPHTQLMQWIQSADLLVLPSHFEGLGLALAEGMALERPVIGTRGTGMEDLIEHGRSGILVPKKDAKALADALKELSDSPLKRVEMGRQARTRILTAFNAAAVADRWHQLIQQIVHPS